MTGATHLWAATATNSTDEDAGLFAGNDVPDRVHPALSCSIPNAELSPRERRFAGTGNGKRLHANRCRRFLGVRPRTGRPLDL